MPSPKRPTTAKAAGVAYAAQMGLKHLMGGEKPGASHVGVDIPVTSATPMTVTFASLGLPNMADTDYQVSVQAGAVDFASAGVPPSIDPDSRTTKQFVLVGAATGAPVMLQITGRFSGATGKNGI